MTVFPAAYLLYPWHLYHFLTNRQSTVFCAPPDTNGGFFLFSCAKHSPLSTFWPWSQYPPLTPLWPVTPEPPPRSEWRWYRVRGGGTGDFTLRENPFVTSLSHENKGDFPVSTKNYSDCNSGPKFAWIPPPSMRLAMDRASQTFIAIH